MPYRTKSYRRPFRNATRGKKYTSTETLAFNLGRQQRIVEAVRSNKSSKVKDSYYAGYKGPEKANKQKPLI